MRRMQLASVWRHNAWAVPSAPSRALSYSESRNARGLKQRNGRIYRLQRCARANVLFEHIKWHPVLCLEVSKPVDDLLGCECRNCGFEGVVLSRTFSRVLFCQKFDELVVQFT
jgi:hypothetical protein